MTKPEIAIAWRHQYDFVTDAILRRATDIPHGGPSLTIQAPALDCDINEIVRRFGIGETQLPPAPDPTAYGDLSDLPDLRAVLDLARDATERFYGLPSRIRTRFENDPAKLWDFVNDPQNDEEAVELGLLVRLDKPLQVASGGTMEEGAKPPVPPESVVKVTQG